MKRDASHFKPSYSLSREQLRISFWLAWLVIFCIVGFGLVYHSREAIDLASIVIPSMILLIMGMLGIHRFAGASDFRSSVLQASTAPPYEPRDQPAGDNAEVQ
ncbi:NAD(P)+ transhydrogenase beta chain